VECVSCLGSTSSSVILSNSRALLRSPSSGFFHLPRKEVVLWRPDNLVEVLEDEEELRELVECVEAMAQLGPMTVLREHAVAEAVDRGDGQLRKVARVAHLTRCGRHSVAQLEGCLLGEGAEHELPSLRLLQQQQVQRAKDNAVSLARPRARDHEQGTVEVPDDRTLGVVEVPDSAARWRAQCSQEPRLPGAVLDEGLLHVDDPAGRKGQACRATCRRSGHRAILTQRRAHGCPPQHGSGGRDTTRPRGCG